ncbi:unnamed protein product [Scytosiphon promiscuus]
MASGFDLSLLEESVEADANIKCDDSSGDEREDVKPVSAAYSPADPAAAAATATAAAATAAAAAVHYRKLRDFEPDFKRQVCRELCVAVTTVGLEALREKAAEHGAEVLQAWNAPKDRGFKAVAARATVDEEDVLIVCFRSTFGLDEWLMYPATLIPPTFLPHAGSRLFPAVEGGEVEKKKGRRDARGVYRVWEDTINEMWEHPGDVVSDGPKDTMREMIWRQLNQGKRVWLTGHSKGGAIATTASSRLLLGDAVDDADTGTAAADPTARRPGEEVITAGDGRSPLSKLSVITFNAPKAFTKALAELYVARMALVQGEHLRFTHKGDAMRSAPLIPGMSHVGQKIKYGDKLVNGKGVLLTGAALALGGPVAAVVGAGAYFGKKMEDNHCGH